MNNIKRTLEECLTQATNKKKLESPANNKLKPTVITVVILSFFTLGTALLTKSNQIVGKNNIINQGTINLSQEKQTEKKKAIASVGWEDLDINEKAALTVFFFAEYPIEIREDIKARPSKLGLLAEFLSIKTSGRVNIHPEKVLQLLTENEQLEPYQVAIKYMPIILAYIEERIDPYSSAMFGSSWFSRDLQSESLYGYVYPIEALYNKGFPEKLIPPLFRQNRDTTKVDLRESKNRAFAWFATFTKKLDLEKTMMIYSATQREGY
jgi:hypothetical protein